LKRSAIVPVLPPVGAAAAGAAGGGAGAAGAAGGSLEYAGSSDHVGSSADDPFVSEGLAAETTRPVTEVRKVSFS